MNNKVVKGVVICLSFGVWLNSMLPSVGLFQSGLVKQALAKAKYSFAKQYKKDEKAVKISESGKTQYIIHADSKSVHQSVQDKFADRISKKDKMSRNMQRIK